jgi:hypothetical protein
MMPINRKIKLAQTDEEIKDCYLVMAELRPHILEQEFLPRVKRQMNESGFKLVYLKDGEVKAVGGVGYGGALFDWIVEYAKRENCDQNKLVSHVERFAAHRFYLNRRMIIEAHYFSLSLK